MVKKDDVVNALKQCYDPELQIDVWTLGLIYNLDIDKNIVKIKMTFTTPACPYGPMLLNDVKSKVLAVKGIDDINIELVFNPPWEPSEELRAMLGV